MSVFNVNNLRSLVICIHLWNIITVKVINISITFRSFLLPLFFCFYGRTLNIRSTFLNICVQHWSINHGIYSICFQIFQFNCSLLYGPTYVSFWDMFYMHLKECIFCGCFEQSSTWVNQVRALLHYANPLRLHWVFFFFFTEFSLSLLSVIKRNVFESIAMIMNMSVSLFSSVQWTLHSLRPCYLVHTDLQLLFLPDELTLWARSLPCAFIIKSILSHE